MSEIDGVKEILKTIRFVRVLPESELDEMSRRIRQLFEPKPDDILVDDLLMTEPEWVLKAQRDLTASIKDAELPDCPYGAPSWTEYERSIFKQGQQSLVNKGWVKEVK